MAEVQSVELAVEAPAGNSRLKPLLLLAAAVLLTAGATVAALFYLGMLPSAGVAQDVPEEQAAAAPDPPDEAVYIALDPDFTVNLRDGERSRFLQLRLQAMARDPDVEKLVKRHMPAIRNDLMMLFGAKKAADLETREGKIVLQGEAVEAINAILLAEEDSEGVEAVYFTGFVMQ